MPRDGSGQYTKPSGSTAVFGQIIDPTAFNTLVDDLAADNNAARPIVAGGTGSTTATAARTALGLGAADSVTHGSLTVTNLTVLQRAEFVDAAAMGVTADGTTDDSTALQDAILEAEGDGLGRALLLPLGISLISAKIRIRQAINIVSQGYGGPNRAGNGNPIAGRAMWRWNSAAPPIAEMVLWQSATLGETIVGGSIRGLVLDGNAVAPRALTLASAWSTLIDQVYTVRTITTGMRITDQNEFESRHVHVRHYEHNMGVDAAVDNVVGLELNGDVTGRGVNFCKFDKVVIQHLNNDGLRLRAATGNLFTSLYIDRRNNDGTGRNINFATNVNFPDADHSQRNVILHAAGEGNIFIANKCQANHIVAGEWSRGTIEYASDTDEAGKRTFHVDHLVDFRSGEAWATPKLALIKTIEAPMGAAGPGYNGTTTANSSDMGAVATGLTYDMPDAAVTGRSWAVRLPYDECAAGTITGLRIGIYNPTAAEGNLVLSAAAEAFSGQLTSTMTLANQTFEMPVAANRVRIFEFTFGTPVAVARDDWVAVAISRAGTDAADTYPAAVRIASVEMLYQAAGPDSLNYGPYDPPLRFSSYP